MEGMITKKVKGWFNYPSWLANAIGKDQIEDGEMRLKNLLISQVIEYQL